MVSAEMLTATRSLTVPTCSVQMSLLGSEQDTTLRAHYRLILIIMGIGECRTAQAAKENSIGAYLDPALTMPAIGTTDSGGDGSPHSTTVTIPAMA